MVAHGAAAEAGALRTSIGARLSIVYRLVRFSAIGFSVLLPLLGVASTGLPLSAETVLGMVAVAAAFHVFAYVTNDLVDLRIDRSEPLRRRDPLVRGDVRPQHALAIALVQLPICLGLTAAMAGDWRAYSALAAAVGGMTAYNLWGKRTAFPPLTDAIQALAWCCLALYGVCLAAGAISPLTWTLLAAVFVYVMMINGVHGALRDLDNDRRCDARTTAILLGARLGGDGGVIVPAALRNYAASLQAMLLSLAAAALVLLEPVASPRRWIVALMISLLAAVLCAQLSRAAWRVRHDKWGMVTAGLFHLVASLGLLVSPWIALMSPGLLAWAATAYFLPVGAMLLRSGSRWG